MSLELVLNLAKTLGLEDERRGSWIGLGSEARGATHTSLPEGTLEGRSSAGCPAPKCWLRRHRNVSTVILGRKRASQISPLLFHTSLLWLPEGME